MNARIIFIIVICFMINWIWPTPSRACSCVPPPAPERAVAEADAVFLARVIAFEEMPAQQWRLARLEPIEIWKGRLAEADSVYTSWSSASCGCYFEAGETYLIYAYQQEHGRLWTHLCTRNAPIAEAGEDLEYLKSFSLFPLAVGNYWQYPYDNVEQIVDTLRIAGLLYFRIDRFREFAASDCHFILSAAARPDASGHLRYSGTGNQNSGCGASTRGRI